MKNLLPSLLTPAAIFTRLLNRLLQQETWAMAQLSKHSGKTVQLCLGSKISIKAGINSEGLTHTVDSAIQPNVILSIPSENLSQIPLQLRQQDPDKLTQLIHIQGDASLAQTVSYLAQNLRWDTEHTLAKFLGDLVAMRILGNKVRMFKFMATSTRHVSENLGEYLAHESNLMANQQAFSVLSSDLDKALKKIQSLEQRLNNININNSGQSNGTKNV